MIDLILISEWKKLHFGKIHLFENTTLRFFNKGHIDFPNILFEHVISLILGIRMMAITWHKRYSLSLGLRYLDLILVRTK